MLECNMTINDIIVIQYNRGVDIRGFSSAILTSDDSSDDALRGFSQTELFVSKSRKDVIRGMHFQPLPYGQKKLVSVLEGSIEGVVLDLREESSTYLQFDCIDLSSEMSRSILIPELCAWGFKAKTDALLLYSIDGNYRRDHDRGIRWDSFGHNWNLDSPIMSERDYCLPLLEEYLSKTRTT